MSQDTSEHHDTVDIAFLDRYWQAFVIGFGVVFILTMALYKPGI